MHAIHVILYMQSINQHAGFCRHEWQYTKAISVWNRSAIFQPWSLLPATPEAAPDVTCPESEHCCIWLFSETTLFGSLEYGCISVDWKRCFFQLSSWFPCVTAWQWGVCIGNANKIQIPWQPEIWYFTWWLVKHKHSDVFVLKKKDPAFCISSNISTDLCAFVHFCFQHVLHLCRWSIKMQMMCPGL